LTRLLLSHKADANIETIDNKTPLMVAVEKERHEVVEILKTKMAALKRAVAPVEERSATASLPPPAAAAAAADENANDDGANGKP